MMLPVEGYEILEHTADLGIRAWGPSIEKSFEQAAWGLIDVIGIRAEGQAGKRTIRATGSDAPALLVDFLNELVFLYETEGLGVSAIKVTRLSDTELEAELSVLPLPGQPEGVGVKAATYHRLAVERRADGGAEVRVYVDV